MMHNMILALILWINCSKVNQMVKFDKIRLPGKMILFDTEYSYWLYWKPIEVLIYWLRGLPKSPFAKVQEKQN